MKIGVLHPVMELAALAVAVWAALATSGWLLWAGCFLGWTLLALAVIDARHFLLPDGLALPLIPAGLAVAWGVDPSSLFHHALGALAGYAVLASIGWAYRRLRGWEGLGQGDAKLFAAAGAWVSWTGLGDVALIGATTALLAVSVARLMGRPVTRLSPVPFGAFLCFGLWIVWIYGPLANKFHILN